MKQRTRRVLFWLAVLLFGVATAVAIVYAQGYKYDWSRNSFVRTGAVAVSLNTDATFFVDDIEVGTTSFLSHRVGKDALLPGPHTIRLLKEDWSAWRKTAEIHEGQLVDFPSVLLLPLSAESKPALTAEVHEALLFARTMADATPTPSPRPKKATPPVVTLDEFELRGEELWFMDTASGSLIADRVLGFSPTENGDRVLWFTRNEVWVRWLRNTDYQPFRAEGETQLITRFSVPITRAAWFRDFDHIVVDLGSGGYRVLETDTRGGINIIKI
jgi:hypothetical protein